jgi:hypothetical protein
MTLFSDLVSKSMVMFLSGLASKSMVVFLFEPQNQGGEGFFNLDLKIGGYDLVI